MLLFLLIPIVGHVYVFWHVWNIVPLNNWLKIILLVLLSLGFISFVVGFGAGLDKMPMTLATAIYELGTSSIFVLLYAVMLFLLLDLGRLAHLVPKQFLYNSLPGTLTVLGILLAVFVYGNIHYLSKNLTMRTSILNVIIRYIIMNHLVQQHVFKFVFTLLKQYTHVYRMVVCLYSSHSHPPFKAHRAQLPSRT